MFLALYQTKLNITYDKGVYRKSTIFTGCPIYMTSSLAKQNLVVRSWRLQRVFDSHWLANTCGFAAYKAKIKIFKY